MQLSDVHIVIFDDATERFLSAAVATSVRTSGALIGEWLKCTQQWQLGGPPLRVMSSCGLQTTPRHDLEFLASEFLYSASFRLRRQP